MDNGAPAGAQRQRVRWGKDEQRSGMDARRHAADGMERSL